MSHKFFQDISNPHVSITQKQYKLVLMVVGIICHFGEFHHFGKYCSNIIQDNRKQGWK